MKTLRCRLCHDEIPVGLYTEASEALFVADHNQHRHAVTQAELALERGDLRAALRALVWVIHERTDGLDHIPAVMEV